MKCFGWHFMWSKPNNKVLCQKRCECTLGSCCFLGRWAHWLKNAWLWKGKRKRSVHEQQCSKCAVWRSLCSSDLLFLMMPHQQGGARRFPHHRFHIYFTAMTHPHVLLPIFPPLLFPFAPPFSPPSVANPFSTSGCLFSFISLLSSSLSPFFSLLVCSAGRPCQCVVCQCGNSRGHRGPFTEAKIKTGMQDAPQRSL